MLGREAYTNPWILSDVDARLFGRKNEPVTRETVIEEMTAYLKVQYPKDPRVLRGTARHMLGLLNGLAGAKAWRRFLSNPLAYERYKTEVLREAFARAGWRESCDENSRFDDDEFSGF